MLLCVVETTVAPWSALIKWWLLFVTHTHTYTHKHAAVLSVASQWLSQWQSHTFSFSQAHTLTHTVIWMAVSSACLKWPKVVQDKGGVTGLSDWSWQTLTGVWWQLGGVCGSHAASQLSLVCVYVCVLRCCCWVAQTRQGNKETMSQVVITLWNRPSKRIWQIRFIFKVEVESVLRFSIIVKRNLLGKYQK